MSDFDGLLELGTIAAVEVAASELAARGEATKTCPNCGTKMIGPYCAVCGQERDTHRRSVYALVRDLVVDIVSFDSRVLRTARALVVQPGELARAFREGRTRRYVPAVRLYLFVSLIFFLMLSFTGLAILQLQVTAEPQKIVYDAKGNAFIENPAYDPNDEDAKFIPKLIPLPKEKIKPDGKRFSYSTQVHFFAPIGAYKSEMSDAARKHLEESDVEVTLGEGENASGKKRPRTGSENWLKTRIDEGMKRVAADPAALNGPLTVWIPRALFLLLPLYAVLLAIFYFRKRKQFYFVDHLIFSLNVHTFLFVALLGAAALSQVLPGEIVAWAVFGAMTLYIYIGMKRFYEQGWFWTTVKFLMVSGIYTLFFLIPAVGTAIALSFFNV